MAREAFYRFTVVAAKDDGEITETGFSGIYDSDAQAEMMARRAAYGIEGIDFIRVVREGLEWTISP